MRVVLNEIQSDLAEIKYLTDSLELSIGLAIAEIEPRGISGIDCLYNAEEYIKKINKTLDAMLVEE